MTTDQNPYASPAIITDASLESVSRGRPVTIAPYLSPRPRSNFTTLFLILSIVANIGIALSLMFTQSLLQQMAAGSQPTAAEIATDTTRLGFCSVSLITVRIIAVIGFMFWTYRVARNLPALGTEDPEYSPGWTVGFYFIPILNLFRPYQAMLEVWIGSSPKQLDWKEKSQVSVPLLSVWWGVWLASAFVGRMLQGMAQGERGVDELLTHNYLVIAVVLLLEIPRDLLSIWLVRTVTAAQEQRHHLLVASPPPPAASSNPFAIG
jgi:hypothetical protein